MELPLIAFFPAMSVSDAPMKLNVTPSFVRQTFPARG